MFLSLSQKASLRMLLLQLSQVEGCFKMLLLLLLAVVEVSLPTTLLVGACLEEALPMLAASEVVVVAVASLAATLVVEHSVPILEVASLALTLGEAYLAAAAVTVAEEPRLEVAVVAALAEQLQQLRPVTVAEPSAQLLQRRLPLALGPAHPLLPDLVAAARLLLQHREPSSVLPLACLVLLLVLQKLLLLQKMRVAQPAVPTPRPLHSSPILFRRNSRLLPRVPRLCRSLKVKP
mmetsp:Transcript_70395/g.168604  ORF Transcript_70395/g.168604 Transcript_70395/m.168604 type:complete len:235 (-) Transcript_70395:1887-2591(-)